MYTQAGASLRGELGKDLFRLLPADLATQDPHQWLLLEQGEHAFGAPVTSRSFLAGRLAYFFDLQWPTLAVDTACSSGLVALHLASRALSSGEATAAVVGAATAFLTLRGHALYCSTKALSPSGRCRTFDAAADGYTPGARAARSSWSSR